MKILFWLQRQLVGPKTKPCGKALKRYQGSYSAILFIIILKTRRDLNMINDVMSRQVFLKVYAKMAALAALGLGRGVSFREQVASAADEKSRGVKWHKAPCRF